MPYFVGGWSNINRVSAMARLVPCAGGTSRVRSVERRYRRHDAPVRSRPRRQRSSSVCHCARYEVDVVGVYIVVVLYFFRGDFCDAYG